MLQSIKQGWSSTMRQFSILILLFIYQLGWGLVLYQFIQSIIHPLLRRYPGNIMPESTVQLFFNEAQFQLAKTHISYSYITIFALLVLFRIIISPLIQAGLCHAIHVAPMREKRSFLQGVKRYGRTFIMLYWLQLVLALLPLYWIWPYAYQVYVEQFSLQPIIMELLPVLIGWGLYGFVLHLFFLYIQIGKVSQRPFLASITAAGRHLLPIAGVALLLLLFSGLIAGIVAMVSMVWAGLLAILLHQMYHLLRTIFKVWGITSQYHLWEAKSN